MVKIHELKTLPIYYRAIDSGTKTFEVRKDDRNFILGDFLLLKEFIPKNYNGHAEHYTGKELLRKIVYILKGGQFGIKKGYVVLGLSK